MVWFEDWEPQIGFNAPDELFGRAIKDAKRSYWPVATPVFLTRRDIALDGRKAASSSTETIGDLIVFARQMVGCLMHLERA